MFRNKTARAKEPLIEPWDNTDDPSRQAIGAMDETIDFNPEIRSRRSPSFNESSPNHKNFILENKEMFSPALKKFSWCEKTNQTKMRIIAKQRMIKS